MNNQVKYTLLKNLQTSMTQIASELQTVRMTSPRDEGIIQANLGRIQGLAQGLDFFIEQYNENNNGKMNSIGFQLISPEEDQSEVEEDRKRVPQ